MWRSIFEKKEGMNYQIIPKVFVSRSFHKHNLSPDSLIACSPVVNFRIKFDKIEEKNLPFQLI